MRMQNSTLNSSFVNRLKQILERRYGKGLQIRQLMDIAQLQSGETFTRGRDLHIPIQVNGAYLGMAVVPGAEDLNTEKRTGIAQIVRMVLEPAMYKWYLDKKESNLEEITKAHLNLENVRLFGEPRPPTMAEILEEQLKHIKEGPTGELISHLIHLEGRSENTNKKVALYLHELTGRWAFVPFNDIKSQLHSEQDISKLGAMTIFIEKIEELNSFEQSLLLEYIAEDHASDEPLLITSTTKQLDALAKCELNANFIDELTVNAFEVDRAPLNTQSLKDVLELFFLKERPLDA